MKQVKRISVVFAAVLALSGCASIPGGQEIAALGTSAVDALTGPDTDYKNYLASCRAQMRSQMEAVEAESKLLQAGLSSKDAETRYGTTLILAFKAGQGGTRIGCSLDRRPGFTELLLKNNSILDAGIQLYGINRADKRFQRQLDANKEMARDRMEFELGLEDRRNDLLTTITGDKLQLRESEQGFQLERDRINAVPAVPTTE